MPLKGELSPQATEGFATAARKCVSDSRPAVFFERRAFFMRVFAPLEECSVAKATFYVPWSRKPARRTFF